MDSGCSRNMIGDTSNFLSLKANQGDGVSFGRGHKGSILEIGRIRKFANNSINYVYYENGIKYTFFSISQLCDRGNEVKFMTNKCLVTNSSTTSVFMSATRVKKHVCC